MLYSLFRYLDEAYDIPGSGMFQYISFRSALAVILALLITIIFGRSIIRMLRRHQIGEEIRDLGLEGQLSKRGTPTMGGVLILLAVLVPTLLVGRLDNIYVQLMLVSTVWLGCIGFLDDYIKTFRHKKEGLKGRFKIVGQVGLDGLYLPGVLGVEGGRLEPGIDPAHPLYLFKEGHIGSGQAPGAAGNNDGNGGGDKKTPIPLIGRKNITIDGGNSDFVFHGMITPCIVSDSKNITLENFTIGFDRPFHTEAEVVYVCEEEGYFDCTINQKSFPTHTENGQITAYSPYMGMTIPRFLITEYDTHGKAAFNFNVVCLALRPFTPCCE